MAFLSAVSASSVGQCRRQVPTDDLARKRIHDDGQEHVHTPQTHVGNISYPELVNGGGGQPASYVDGYLEIMPAVGGLRNETAFANGQQTIRAHQTRDPLVIAY
jgi:hypothetical protein